MGTSPDAKEECHEWLVLGHKAAVEAGHGRVVALTGLGRAVRVTAGGTGAAVPQHREEHRQANWLRDVILGGQDRRSAHAPDAENMTSIDCLRADRGGHWSGSAVMFVRLMLDSGVPLNCPSR